MSASAQSHDTLGKYPFIYVGDLPQGGIFHDSVMCTVNIEQMVFANGDSICYCEPYGVTEYATHMFADEKIKIVGLAVGRYTNINYVKLSLYGLDKPEALAWTTGIFEDYDYVDSAYIELGISGYGLPYYHHVTNGLLVTFFDNSSPVEITGDFYIGFSVGYNDIYNRVVLLNHLCEDHEPPYNYPLRSSRLRIDGEWVDNGSSRYIPMLFPIIEPECKAMEEVRVTTDSAGCLVAEWDSVPYQEQWVVAFSHQGTTTFDTVDSCRWRHCGLPAGTPYNISVRSRCTNLNSYTWSPWSGGADIPDPMAVATPEGVHFTVAPNPARDHVTLGLPPVSDSRMELYDATGRRWQSVALPPYAATARLDIAALPAGLYLLRLVTPQGVATRRLMVN